MRNHFDLDGRVALVTGASRGIGKAIALGLAEYGADLAVHCATRIDAVEAVAREAEGFGQRSCALASDLAEPGVPGALVREVEARFGRIDILVLNASLEIRADWTEWTDADFSRQIDINLRSAMDLLRLVLPGMQRRGWGRVVTVGSIQQCKPNPRLLLYAATKSAQLNIARNLARQVSADGVTINNLAPGAIATERNAAVLADPGYRAGVESQIPAGRIGVPEDCIGAALLLCSPAGSYITGADLYVDGGWHVS